jgi:hypothetical protein
MTVPSPIYFLLAQGRGGYSPDGTLPAGAIECTQAQAEDPSAWLVKDSAIAQAPAPVLTLAQQAAAASVAGLSIALSGTMTLAATLFPTDASTQKAIESMNAMARAGVLPLGSTTYPMIDASGTWHHFTASQYQAVAGAIAAYVSACDLIAAGNPMGATSLPAASVSLTV